MQLLAVVNWLRQHLDAPWLSLDEDGSSTIHLDALSIALVPYGEPAGFSLRARLGNAAVGDFTATLESLLKANLFSDGVGASVLGMDAGGNIFLTRRYAFERLMPAPFLAGFDRFLRQATHWHAQLAAAAPAGEARGR